MKNEKEQRDNWRLKELKFELKKGYSFNNTSDRYEGKISFENDEHESFTVKLREDMTEPYLNLIAEEIVKNADELCQRLRESLLKKVENEGI